MKKQTHSIFWLLSCVRARVPSLLALLLLSMANAELGVLFALGTRGVVNAAASGEAAALLRASGMQAALIAALLLTLTGLRALRDSLSANLERDWKRRYLGKLLRTRYEESAKFHTAELLNRMNNDAKAVSDGLVTTLPGLGAMLVRLVGAGLALLSLSPEFTLAALAAGLLVTVLTATARKKLKTLHKALGEAEGKSAAFLQEVLEKLLLVQALDASEAVETRAEALLSNRFALQKRRKNVSLLANTSVSLLGYGAGFVTLVWCAVGIQQGRMTFGDLSAMTALVSQLQGPFVNLSGVLPQMIAMLGSCERLMELDALPDEPECERIDAKSVYEEVISIEADDLSFVYDRETVLDHVSFSIPKGQLHGYYRRVRRWKKYAFEASTRGLHPAKWRGAASAAKQRASHQPRYETDFCLRSAGKSSFQRHAAGKPDACKPGCVGGSHLAGHLCQLHGRIFAGASRGARYAAR